MRLSDISEGATRALENANALAANIVRPGLRLGVTGLSRSGKTVFITALIRNLIAGGWLPFFEPAARGQMLRAYLEPSPRETVPTFRYEDHLSAFAQAEPTWPQSTKRVTQLRLTIDYEPAGLVGWAVKRRAFHLDIVDYPGEWLLDLPLLRMSYSDWSRETLAMSRETGRRDLSRDWNGFLATIDASGPQNEQQALKGAELFRAYLASCRDDTHALSTLPPGRFLVPGELRDSPALTFMPLDVPADAVAPAGSFWSLMERNYEAYKSHVVTPFFRDHFAKLDRQIVLVDTLAALNAGPEAVHDLERALAGVLTCFRQGRNSWFSSIFSPKIDRILFAATKADHLPQSNHPRLKAVLERLTAKAIERARFAGANVEVLAMASVRSTREGKARHDGAMHPCIIGVPMPGERIAERVFDGREEVALFPGDLPEDPGEALDRGRARPRRGEEDVRFVRFRPPRVFLDATGTAGQIPHIYLDRALQFLVGDCLS